MTINGPADDLGATDPPRITRNEDALKRVTTYDYELRGVGGLPARRTFLTQVTAPEGNRTRLQYDALGNITERRKIAKPGSGLADIVETASYPATKPQTTVSCEVEPSFICFRPLWVRDGRNNQTDFKWSSVHGELLEQTGPPDSNGVRSRLRYDYQQRNAWYVGPSGIVIRDPKPIWVKTRESRCRTSQASELPAAFSCAAGAADEIITNYEYGPDGPAVNNLLLRGVAVQSAGTTLRTCYTYDSIGNKLSETAPEGVSSTCP